MPRMLGNAKETSRMSSSTREIMEMLGKVKTAKTLGFFLSNDERMLRTCRRCQATSKNKLEGVMLIKTPRASKKNHGQ
jgi:hypothetical protein